MKLEINENFVKGSDEIDLGNTKMLITPPINEDYWILRVKLYKDQAIVSFPKFSVCMGVGFAREKDWNCNLPANCSAERIYGHIKHNKKYKEITKKMCIKALNLLLPTARKLQEKRQKKPLGEN